MNPILEAAVEVERIVRAARFPFCVIGGIAVQRWGQPRMTADIDLTAITGFGDEERYVDVLLAARDYSRNLEARRKERVERL